MKAKANRCFLSIGAGYVLLWSITGGGCSGAIGDRAGSDSDNPGGPAGGVRGSTKNGDGVDLPPPLESFVCDKAVQPGSPGRLWRLTHAQYTNALAALLYGRASDAAVVPTQKPPTTTLFKGELIAGDRFSTVATSYDVRNEQLPDVLGNAQTLASAHVERVTKTGCLASGKLADCMPELVKQAGEILFRRPLTKSEVDTYVKLAVDAESLSSKSEAASLAFAAMLAAPQFLFRVEIGEGGKLGDFEIASAIALSITDAPADQMLWDAAVAGKLRDSGEIASQVGRLLATKVGGEVAARFVAQWFRFAAATETNKDDKNYRPSNLIGHSASVVKDVVAESLTDGFQEAIFTTRKIYADKDTAAVYGVTTESKNIVAFEADGERAGLLAQPAWLAAYSQPERTDPVRRGRFVRQELLCGEVPEIDITEVAPIPDDPERTMREKLQAHRTDPSCSACHSLLDPIGLGMESFDHLGKFRAAEAGKPVGNAGELVDSGDQDGPFQGMAELGAKLAQSRTVSQCMTRKGFEFWLGRSLHSGDGCSLVAAEKALHDSGGNFVAALQAMFSSDAFLNKIR